MAGRGQTAVTFNSLGQAKIGHARLAVLVEQNIGGLQVAVNDALHVSIGNCPGNLVRQLRCFARRERSIGDFASKARTLDKRHREVVLSLC